ncbi:Protein of unknown function DUF2765 [Desulfovibrio sp. X2]|uniref:putative phage tail assembly chaperone n=1 Tax=Desulfovibrio sp. X2 TaxID=941449 RepID=UPI0003589F8D|nr:putative phage tail assembly chaperone [Desulfovibrio sp. X2]EPR43140.1 Protein of unknown function DUF2765 [Desulfovibrio sp. X2]
MKKRITLKINGKDVAFDVDTPTYDAYLNALQPTNKTGPARNFLMRTVCAESRDDIKAILELPGAGVQIAAKLLEEFTPDLEIELGE